MNRESRMKEWALRCKITKVRRLGLDRKMGSFQFLPVEHIIPALNGD